MIKYLHITTFKSIRYFQIFINVITDYLKKLIQIIDQRQTSNVLFPITLHFHSTHKAGNEYPYFKNLNCSIVLKIKSKSIFLISFALPNISANWTSMYGFVRFSSSSAVSHFFHALLFYLEVHSNKVCKLQPGFTI